MITQIFWLLSWPVLIAISYLAVKKVLGKLEQADDQSQTGQIQ